MLSHLLINTGSDEPKTMLTGKCYSCHNSTTKVKCTGNLVRSQNGFFQNWWINSKNCIKAGGLCCHGKKTLGSKGFIRVERISNSKMYFSL